MVPTDKITVYYQASGHLGEIIPQFMDLIAATIKQPIVCFTAGQSVDGEIINNFNEGKVIFTFKICNCFKMAAIHKFYCLVIAFSNQGR